MNKLLSLLVVVFLMGWRMFTPSLQAQNSCYILKDEASGFDVSPYLDSLEAKACKLRAAFDSTNYANSFKVFSFGFYVDLEYYDGYSYPQAFIDMQEEVEQESPYYLLIGRQSDHTGVFTKYWVHVKLPDEAPFNCMDGEMRSNLSEKLQTVTQKHPDLPYSIEVVEKELMDVLFWHINQAINCECNLLGESGDCELCRPTNILQIDLKAEGFRDFDLRQVQQGTGSATNNGGIYDAFKGTFKFGSFSENHPLFNETFNIADEIIESKQQLDGLGTTGKVYILREQDVCQSVWDEMQVEITEGTYDYIECHIIFKNSSGNGGKLYSRYYLKDYGNGNRSNCVLNPWWSALKALGAAAIDATFQAVLIRLTDEEVSKIEDEWEAWSAAWGKISYLSAAWEGISSLLPWKKLKYDVLFEAAAQGFIVVLDKARQDPSCYTLSDGLTDFVAGAGASLLTKCVFRWADHGVGVLIRGLDSWYKTNTFAIVRTVIEEASFYIRNKLDNLNPLSNELKDAYKAIFISPAVREINTNVKHVYDYVVKNPGTMSAIKDAFNNLVESRRQLFVNGIKNAAQEPLSISVARRATPDEIGSTVNKIMDHRISVNNLQNNNYGYIEGNLGSIIPDGIPVSSGPPDNNISQIFEAIPVNSQNIPNGDNSWLRNTDSEYKMLNRLANQFGAEVGGEYPNISGTL